MYLGSAEEFRKQYDIISGELPSYFVTSGDIKWQDRIEIQGIAQHSVDTAISSTVNLPQETTLEEIEQLYLEAWKHLLKGVTIYRSGCKREGILTIDETPQNEEEVSNEDKTELVWGTTLESSDDLIGLKRKIKTGCGSLHVQAYFDGGDGQLMEVFLSKGGSGGCQGYMNALSRLISAALRTGLPFDYAIDQLQSVPGCPSYVKRDNTSKGNCCPSAIGYALIEMQKEIFNDLICDECEDEIIPTKQDTTEPQIKNNKAKCPECGEEVNFIGGCNQCGNCGWSKCD